MSQCYLAPGEDTGGRTLKRLHAPGRDAAQRRRKLDAASTGLGPRCLHRGLSMVRWAAFACLAAYLLFAHGCHPGDHDDELFTWVRAMVP